MSRYLLLADGHFSRELCPSEIEAILRLALRLLGKNSALARRVAGYYGGKRSAHLAKAFGQASAGGPFDGFISLGDNFYDWDNLGLDSEEKAAEARELKHLLLDRFDLHGKKNIWVPGNHELGYLNSSLAPIGPSLPPAANFSCYREVYGPAYGIRRLSESFSVVWISTAHIETLAAGPQAGGEDENMAFLIRQREEELDFLSWTLEHLEGRFFFGVHDPGSLFSPRLSSILDRYLPKLAGSFTGHVHAEWLLKLAKLYRPGFRSAFKRYKVQFIPSIWGIVLPFFFWPVGAGWAELSIDGDRAEFLQRSIGADKRKRINL